MKEILFASTNKGKYAEILEVAAAFANFKIVKPDELGLPTPEPQVEETGSTYEANSLLKAQAYHLWAGIPVIADDTGLEVTHLNGRPGVFSARYAGEPQNSQKNIAVTVME
jgi:XTP/dITP diphosphohydrolase